jgi:hypothetical protein
VSERDPQHGQRRELVGLVEVDLLNPLVERLEQPERDEDDQPGDEQQPPLLAAGVNDPANDRGEPELGGRAGDRRKLAA